MRKTLLTLVAIGGCASPRDRDCKALLPLLEDAKSARSMIATPAKPEMTDSGIMKTRFAAPPRERAMRLRALTLRDRGTKEPVASLANATERQAEAMASVDELVLALKITTGEGTGDGFAIVDAITPHVEKLVQRCGIIFRTKEQQTLPDCVALERALERCVTSRSDDTTAEEQLLTCASAFAEVRSDDGATSEATRALATAMRKIEPFSRHVGAPAKEVVRVSKELSLALSKQSAAREDANKAEATIRRLCPSASER